MLSTMHCHRRQGRRVVVSVAAGCLVRAAFGRHRLPRAVASPRHGCCGPLLRRCALCLSGCMTHASCFSSRDVQDIKEISLSDTDVEVTLGSLPCIAHVLLTHVTSCCLCQVEATGPGTPPHASRAEQETLSQASEFGSLSHNCISLCLCQVQVDAVHAGPQDASRCLAAIGQAR